MAKVEIKMGEIGGGGAEIVISNHSMTRIATSTAETINIPKSGTLYIQVSDLDSSYASPLYKNGTAITATADITYSGHYNFTRYYEVPVSSGDVITISGGNGYRWIMGYIE